MLIIALQSLAAIDPLVPNPRPQAPEGVQETVNMVVGWLKYGGLVAGVVGLLICAIMMALGRRNRSQMSVEGAAGVPWALAAMSLIFLAGSFVSAFIQ
ncbi:hypothetical protein E0F15_10215 [Frankia sp. B2]|uniref:hypothetical protein n=1 Tax=unclassified Frankia TaxID=2632575 RepID=UPI0004617AF6|nr:MULTISPECIES: hypothetical protein [unclassified Frankia]KDA40863.1 hypothetical protein BMG523Draft_04327 [Frankia sp. BMG5.23]TFE31143.1 hypothetical protein E0F15_10215 [Frankia sp. B2]